MLCQYSIRSALESDKDFVWQQHVKANQVYIDKHMGVSYEVNRGYFDINFPKQQCFIIEQFKKTVGCYCLNEYETEVKLSRFFLLDEFQGQGIGHSIVKELLLKYRHKNMFVNVWVDNSVQAFWQKMGFMYESTDEDNLMKLVVKAY